MKHLELKQDKHPSAGNHSNQHFVLGFSYLWMISNYSKRALHSYEDGNLTQQNMNHRSGKTKGMDFYHCTDFKRSSHTTTTTPLCTFINQ